MAPTSQSPLTRRDKLKENRSRGRLGNVRFGSKADIGLALVCPLFPQKRTSPEHRWDVRYIGEVIRSPHQQHLIGRVEW
jgi:hypothetical protein